MSLTSNRLGPKSGALAYPIEAAEPPLKLDTTSGKLAEQKGFELPVRFTSSEPTASEMTFALPSY
jgi:hypothetical protein